MTERTVHSWGLLAIACVASACNDSTSSPALEPYSPEIPAAWQAAISNPYFPLVPGTTYRYAGQTADGFETIVVETLLDTRLVQGVTATTVRDRVYLDGELIEDTYDWYAQDSAGNVWYLGEDSKEIDDGQVVSTEGSWEWGIDGALPGIIMWADPAAHVGTSYRQEFYEGEAEDWAKILAVDENVQVPYGSLQHCLRIEEWPGLDPEHREFKYFAPGLGNALEVSVDGHERLELIEIKLP